MNKRNFGVPIYTKKLKYSEIHDETLHNTINEEINDICEIFFGESLADRHEKFYQF